MIPQQHSNEIIPQYDEAKYFAQFGIHSYKREKFQLDTFPRISENEEVVEELNNLANLYLRKPPKVVVIEGGVGSGKTGAALSLLNLLNPESNSIAQIQYYDFNHIYFNYVLNGDLAYLPFRRFCLEVDFLLFDDYGLYLTDKSETMISATNELVKIVKERIELDKFTILACNNFDTFDTGEKIRRYVEYLKMVYPAINMGNVDLRIYSDDINDHIGNKSPTHYILGKDWLIEKYDLIDKEIDQVILTLLRPDEDDVAMRTYIRETQGDHENRVEEINKRLLRIKSNVSVLSSGVKRASCGRA